MNNATSIPTTTTKKITTNVSLSQYFVANMTTRKNLVDLKIHLPLIPESAQGFFSEFKYKLKNVKFNTQ